MKLYEIGAPSGMVSNDSLRLGVILNCGPQQIDSTYT